MTAPDRFDDATAVRPTATSGSYDATLSSTWAIGDKPHGGYLLALAGRAAGAEVPAAHPVPVSTSAVFLRSPSFGPAEVHVEVLRSGRSVSHVESTIVQDGRPCLRALHVFSALDPSADVRFLGEAPPALPPWDQCAPRPRPPKLPDGTEIRIGIAEAVEMRIDPSSLSEGGADRSRAELRAWLSWRDGRAPDPLALLFAVDALPPATFALGIPGWVPTLELTAYLRAMPAPGPLQVRQRARLVHDNRMDEVCDVWDSNGHLVAQATQLAGVRLR